MGLKVSVSQQGIIPGYSLFQRHMSLITQLRNTGRSRSVLPGV